MCVYDAEMAFLKDEGVQKQLVKGGAAVDPDSELDSVAHLLQVLRCTTHIATYFTTHTRITCSSCRAVVLFVTLCYSCCHVICDVM